jgi:hypothetical protein
MSSPRTIAGLDRAAMWGMAAGILLMLQPWWLRGFRIGFFATAAFTLAQIVTSHLRTEAR